MRSIVTVASPASDTALTTLTRVKQELNISVTTYDTVLQFKIDEASDDIEAALGFRVARESAVETFWHDENELAPAALVLDRAPIVSIASVVLDGATVDSSLYRYDAKTGELFALDASGYTSVWIFCQNVIVTYTAGYILPSASNRTLPKGIEGACIDLVSSFWASKGRDSALKSEEVPGVLRKEYWVGSVGEDGELPPGVMMKLAPYRRANVA